MRFLVILILISLVSCLHTKVEVKTTIFPLGGGVRSIVVESRDNQVPKPLLPSSMLIAADGWSLREDLPSRRSADISFARLQDAPPPFALLAKALHREVRPLARLTITDWGLFQHYAYQGTLREVVSRDEIAHGLLELLEVTLATGISALEVWTGPDWDLTPLVEELSGKGGKGYRLATLIWEEIAEGGEGQEQRIARRASVLLHGMGLEIPAEEFKILAAENPAEIGKQIELRKRVHDWLAARISLRPDATGKGRQPILPDLGAILFSEAFASAWEEQLLERFGSDQAVDAWAEATLAQVGGLFGPGGTASGSYNFRFHVQLPGQLLRSNGWLGDDGWTFLAFTGKEVYPSGQSLLAESVDWSPSLNAILGLPPRNEVALGWMAALGGSNHQAPPAGFLATMQACARQASLIPLRNLVADEEADGGEKNVAQKALDYLEDSR